MREARLAKELPAVQRRAKLVLITLQQRLLSSIEAFARTIGVHRQAMMRAAEKQVAGSQEVPRDLRQMLLPISADDERAEVDAEQVEEQVDTALEVATSAAVTEADLKEGLERELKALDDLEALAQQYRSATPWRQI